MEIALVDRQRARKVALAPLRRYLERLVAAEPPREGARGMAVALVSDRGMRALNRAFRGQDAPTDVLSFPDGGAWLGDIAISVDRALAQARRRGATPARGIRTLLVHGYLHLNGYDHETDDGAMMRRQRSLVARLAPRRKTP